SIHAAGLSVVPCRAGAADRSRDAASGSRTRLAVVGARRARVRGRLPGGPVAVCGFHDDLVGAQPDLHCQPDAVQRRYGLSSAVAHGGSPDTFFVGNAGAYPVRIVVRLPGVIPGRAQVTVRITDDVAARDVQRVTMRAAQWNLGIDGAPPPEVAKAVPGDSAL